MTSSWMIVSLSNVALLAHRLKVFHNILSALALGQNVILGYQRPVVRKQVEMTAGGRFFSAQLVVRSHLATADAGSALLVKGHIP